MPTISEDQIIVRCEEDFLEVGLGYDYQRKHMHPRVTTARAFGFQDSGNISLEN